LDTQVAAVEVNTTLAHLAVLTAVVLVAVVLQVVAVQILVAEVAVAAETATTNHGLVVLEAVRA